MNFQIASIAWNLDKLQREPSSGLEVVFHFSVKYLTGPVDFNRHRGPLKWEN